MGHTPENTPLSREKANRGEFWEVWVLAAILVTIFGLLDHSGYRSGDKAQQAQNRMDPYDIRPEEPHGARAVETGY